MQRVLVQVELLRNGSERRCLDHNQCVVELTGPEAYWEGARRAARASGCTASGAFVRAADCRAAAEPMRRVLVCDNDAPGTRTSVPHWVCGTARHWDCRLSPVHCNDDPSHYMHHRGAFFRTSARR